MNTINQQTNQFRPKTSGGKAQAGMRAIKSVDSQLGNVNPADDCRQNMSSMVKFTVEHLLISKLPYCCEE